MVFYREIKNKATYETAVSSVRIVLASPNYDHLPLSRMIIGFTCGEIGTDEKRWWEKGDMRRMYDVYLLLWFTKINHDPMNMDRNRGASMAERMQTTHRPLT
jgi:hypothetical protein